MATAFRYFVLVHACLVASYLMWRLSAWWAGAEAQRAGARRWVALGRLLVGTSLASPLLCAGVERVPLAARLLPQTPLAGRLLGEADGPGGPAALDAGTTPQAPPVVAERSGGRAQEMLLLTWTAGALAVLLLRAVQWRRLGRFLDGAVPLQRRGRLEVLVHPEAVSPFAARARSRAVVVIPAHLVASGRWREALRHELVHHRRGDTRWTLAAELVTALLWANPVVWLWRKRLGELQELACDEHLMERGRVDPAAYGVTLLEVAEALCARPAPRLGACAPMAGRGRAGRSTLARRLDRILNHSQLRRSDMRSWIAWTLAGLVVWVATVAAWAAAGAEVAPELPRVRIQADLQQLVSEKLAAHLERCGARRGVVVAMDPTSGEVLARAGCRRDGTSRAVIADEEAPFAAHFLGASTMKTLVVAGALEERAVRASDLFDTGDGTLTIDGRTFREWKDGGLGKVSLADVVVKSSNLGVIMVARRLGGERLVGFLDRLGYTVARDAPVADLSCGTYSGVAVTAHQLAYAYTMLINGGRNPGTGEAVVRPEVSELIRHALVRAVEEGTGTQARCKGLAVGGKTGTSVREVDGVGTGTAYFVGFAPAASPRVVVSVIVDDVGSGVNGNRHAAPLFREIVESGLPMLEKTATASR